MSPKPSVLILTWSFQVLLLLWFGFVHSQQEQQEQLLAFINITTIAGYDAYSDGIPASRLSLFQPSSILITENDDLMILESGSAKIRLLNRTTMTVSTLSGQVQQHASAWMWYVNFAPSDNGVGKNAVLLTPTSMTFSPNKEIIVSSTGRYIVRQISLTNNVVQTIAGIEGTGEGLQLIDNVLAVNSYLRRPISIVLSFDRQYYYILEYGANTIRKVNIASGIISSLYGDGTPTYMFKPTCMFLHPSGSFLYICDDGHKKILKLVLNGNAVDSSSVIVGTGSTAYSVDGTIGTSASIEGVMGLVSSKSASPNIYFSSGNRIRMLNGIDQKVYTVAGGSIASFKDNDIATNCLLNAPTSLALSLDETLLYIVDSGNGRIRQLNLQTNIMTTIAGIGGSYAFGEENVSPKDTPLFYDKLTLTSNSNSVLYSTLAPVPDANTIIYKIRKIENGIVKTIAGSSSATTCSGQTCDAFSVKLSDIGGMTQSPNGELYIAERSGCRIRKLAGSTLTVIVGTGICGNNTATGDLSSSQVNKPSSIVFQDNRNVWYFIEDNSSIKLVNGSVLNTVAGGGISDAENVQGTSSLIYPTCLAWYNGEVFFCEKTRIRKVDIYGMVTTVVGLNRFDNTSGATALDAIISPTSISFSPRGELFFTDLDNHIKYVYNNSVYFLKTEQYGFYGNFQQISISKNSIYFYDSYNTRIESMTLSCSKGSILGANLTCVPCIGNYTNNEDYSQCILSCFGKLKGVDSNICNAHGSCIDQNLCLCESGYTGSTCEIPICFGKLSSESSVCSGVGNCSSPNNCTCLSGYYGSECENYKCFGVHFNSSTVCSSKGKCKSPNNCNCDANWLPDTCSTTTCSGILSNSSSVCRGRGSCLSYNNCNCTNGYFGNECELSVCYGKNQSDPNVCSGAGKCISHNTCECIPYGYTGNECEQIALFDDRYNQKMYANSSKLLSIAPSKTRAFETIVDIDGYQEYFSKFNILWDRNEFTVYYDEAWYGALSYVTLCNITFQLVQINTFPSDVTTFSNSFRYYPLSEDFELDTMNPYSVVGLLWQMMTVTNCLNCSSSFISHLSYKASTKKYFTTGLQLFKKESLSNITLSIQLPVGTFPATSSFYFVNTIPEPIIELVTRRGSESIFCLGYHCVLEYSVTSPSDTIVKSSFNGDYSIRNSNKPIVRLMNYNSQNSISNYYSDSIRYNATSIKNGLSGRKFTYPINYVAFNNIPLSLSFLEKQQDISKSFSIRSLLTDPYILQINSFSFEWKCSYKNETSSVFISFPCPQTNGLNQLYFKSNYFKLSGTLSVSLKLGSEQVSSLVYIVNQDIPHITTRSILPKIHSLTEPIQIDAFIQSSSPISKAEWNVEFGQFFINSTQQVLSSSSSIIQKVGDNLYSISLNIPSRNLVPLEKYIISLNVTNSLGVNSFIRQSTTIDRYHYIYCSANRPVGLSKLSVYCFRQENDIDLVSNVFVFIPKNNSTRRIVVSNTIKHSFSTPIPFMIGGSYSIELYSFSQHGSKYSGMKYAVYEIPTFPSENFTSFIEQQFTTSIMNGVQSMSSVLHCYSILAFLDSKEQVDSKWLELFIPSMHVYLFNLKDNLGDQVDDKILPLFITTVSTMFQVVSNKTPLDMSIQMKSWLSWIFNSLKTAQQFYNPNLFSWLLVRSHVSEMNSMVTIYSEFNTSDQSFTLSFLQDLIYFSKIFVKDYKDDINMINLPSTNRNVEFSEVIIDSPSLLNSKNVNLPSNRISIQFPKTASSVITLDEPLSLISSVSLSSSGSIGPILSVEVFSESRSTISVKDLSEPITITFNQLSTVKPDNKTFSCQYFDTQNNIWTNSSMSTAFSIISVQDSITTFSISCNTSHLTQFGIFLIDGPKSIVIPPIVASSNQTSSRIQNSDSRLAIILGVTIPIIFIIIVGIIIAVIVVIVIIRVRKPKRKESLNHLNDDIVPIDDNNLISTNVESSVNDIELIETKPAYEGPKSDDFPSMQVSAYQQLTETSIGLQESTTSQQTSSDFPSTYLSAHNYKNSMNSESTSSTVSNDPITMRYKDMVKIGSGGFGSVFKCYDTKSKRSKAIKVMGFQTFDALNGMMKEATQLMNIKHKNIIKVNDMFVSPPQLLCIDMELYEKGDLSKYTKPGIDCKESILKQICYQMLDALSYVHQELNCCHRDVKPSNVFIADENEDSISIVLADFGLAKSNQGASLNSYSGTPLYMSPEIALGSSNYGNNVDVYSLGVSLYQIITKDLTTSINHLYFTKDATAVKIFLEEKMKTSAQYSEDFISLIITMLEKDASTRPQASDLLTNSFFEDQKNLE